MKRLLFLSLFLFGELFAGEAPIHWEYFEPEVDYTRRLRGAGAITNWEIVNQPTPDQTGPSLKLTIRISKQQRAGVLVFDLPPIAFDRISFRVWNPNPSTLPVYLHLSAFQSSSLGASRESISFSSRYYGDATPSPEPGQFLRTDTPSAPLPSSAQSGWIPVVLKFPQDITVVSVNGKRRPPGKDDLDSWKKYAFPTVSLIFETSSPETEPFSLYLDDVEFFLAK